MFVITADQVNSRASADLAPETLSDLEDLDPSLDLPAARFAGDELQFVTSDPGTALNLILRLARREDWSVGLGIGSTRTPLPENPAAASGPAFIRARAAVESAKRSPTRFALVASEDQPGAGPGDDSLPSSDQLGALLDLLLALRGRRSEEGWAVCDLLDAGLTQVAVSEKLGITPQAVSLRVRAAGWRIESRARPGLVVLLTAMDRAESAGSPVDD